MKKILLYAFTLCITFLASCSKDSSSNGGNGGGGSQTTGKRISEIYQSYTDKYYISYDNGLTWTLEDTYTSGNNLSEVWHWNNDKLISIDYYYQNQVDGTDNLYYNNAGLVSRIVYLYNGTESESVEISYNNNKFSQVKFYDEGLLESAYDITYSNNKIHQITCTYMSDDAKPMSKHGKQFFKNIFKTEEISPKDGTLPYVILTWTGNNLTRWQRYSSDNDYYSIYTYDNKNNPYYGGNSITSYVFVWGNTANMSQNNVLSETYYESGEINTNNYSYNYFENYPMQVHETYESIYQYPDYWNKYTSNYTDTYSYLTD
ncbi:MAG: hypothetical protein J6T37_03675 [Bacteroidales bacterium]|nr:hypothetical protein [Bacteroidales bacterium]